jgi:Condensation domain/TubC N-terminal docking domain
LTTSELLLIAARAGITFRLDGDRLAYRAPKGTMTAELRAEIIAHKADLIAMLQRDLVDAAGPVAHRHLAEEEAEGPLASGQERLWLIERRGGPSSLHNIHFRLLWKGPLDQEILALSVRDVAARHAIIRTTFTDFEGIPRAIVSPDDPVDLTYLDLRDQTPQARAAAAGSFALDHQRTPFDLARGPLMRIAAITFAQDEHVLLITQHHIITDGWSVRIFLSELGHVYRNRCLGQPATLPEPTLRYSDYVRWQHQWREEAAYKERLAWWRDHLAELPPLTLGHRQYLQPGAQGYSGGGAEFTVPATLAARLRDLAREQHCTLYTLLLTGWSILLHRYTNQADFAVGSITSGRDRQEFQDVIGFFANTVVLRCDLSGNPTVLEAIARMRAETEAAFEREVPFADIVMAAGAVHDASITPLIQTAFVFQNVPPIPDILNPVGLPRIAADVTVDGRIDGSVEGTAKFDLSLTLKESPDGSIGGYLEYSLAAFEPAAIEPLVEHVLILLEGLVTNPDKTIGRLRLISQGERQRLLVEWNEKPVPVMSPPAAS